MENSSSHLEFNNTDSEIMETEGEATRAVTRAVPNFRRFTRGYNPNTDSDTSREDGVINRFFRVMAPGFEKELKLPSSFCTGLAGVELPDDTILVSCKGMWAFKTEKCSCCSRLLVLSGEVWDDFIAKNNLEEHDLVWFEQTDQVVFRIHVFDRITTCEKSSVEPPDDLRSMQNKRRCLFKDGIRIKGCKDCRFKAKIQEHHLKHTYLTIPTEFLKVNSLRNKKRAVLVNVNGHAWEVELANYQDLRPGRGRSSAPNMKLRKGWPAFFKSNSLDEGHVCVFAIDHGSTLTSSTSIVMNVYVTEP